MKKVKVAVLKDIYKDQATKYANFATESFSWKFIEKPAFNKYINPLLKQDFKALDVGCGDGRIIQYLIANGVKESNIMGVDSSEELLSITRKKLPEVKVIHSDINNPKLSFEELDLITSSMVFFYLDQKQLEKVLTSFHRWLKKDGILFYIVAHPVRFVHKNLGEYFDRKWANQETPWGTKILHFRRTVGDYINATINAGFTIKIVNEPEVLKEGKKNPKDYKKYTSFPSRLVVMAVKS